MMAVAGEYNYSPISILDSTVYDMEFLLDGRTTSE
jgi:hypothetical protein